MACSKNDDKYERSITPRRGSGSRGAPSSRRCWFSQRCRRANLVPAISFGVHPTWMYQWKAGEGSGI